MYYMYMNRKLGVEEVSFTHFFPITQTIVEQDLRRHMASQGHNEVGVCLNQTSNVERNPTDRTHFFICHVLITK